MNRPHLHLEFRSLPIPNISKSYFVVRYLFNSNYCYHFYREVDSKAAIREILGLKEGDPIPKDWGDIWDGKVKPKE
jgi:hypothetical protein